MSECDTCSSPGHCCKGFTLNHSQGQFTVWNEPGWEEKAREYVSQVGMPFFYPLPFVESGDRPLWKHEGRTYFAPQWSCERLGPDGRCTQYEDRPELCRRYEPLQDSLCIMWIKPEEKEK